MNRILTWTISSLQKNMTVEQFLRTCGCSHHVITHLKRTECGFLLNNTWAYTNQKLKSGDTLTIQIVETPAPNILFVYRCINRLDRDTSGLLIIAKHMLSGAILSRMSVERQIHRKYLAIVEGLLPESGTIDMKHIGHPLVGDFLYHPDSMHHTFKEQPAVFFICHDCSKHKIILNCQILQTLSLHETSTSAEEFYSLSMSYRFLLFEPRFVTFVSIALLYRTLSGNPTFFCTLRNVFCAK